MTSISGQRPASKSKLTIAQSIEREFAGREIPAYEVKGPTGGVPSKGTVLAFHGGGWLWSGAQFLRSMDDDVQRWRDRGFTTVNATYMPGKQSILDAVDFEDAILKSRMGGKPTITTGESAGGHLALMVAAKRPKVDLAVGQGAPTSLEKIADEVPAGLGEWVRMNWTRDEMVRDSPMTYADSIHGKVLLGSSSGDTGLVQHARDFKAARPQTRFLEMPSGDEQGPFIHANVDSAALPKFFQAEADMAAKAVKAHYRDPSGRG